MPTDPITASSIIARRNELGLTQLEYAARVGVGLTTIRNIEQGRSGVLSVRMRRRLLADINRSKKPARKQ